MELEILSFIFAGIIGSLAASTPKGYDPHDKGVFIRGKYFRPPRATLTIPGQPLPELYRQCVDHHESNCSDNAFNQRYWQKWTEYEKGGPVFFMFGGEGSAEGLINLYFESYAQHYRAVLVVLEHRFYGESFPTINQPPTVEDLELLTSEQALLDAVRFVQEFKQSYEIEEAKVVAFGGSYPGNLAAWSRQKYPHVFNLAVASSAPVQAKFDFPEYVEVVSDVIGQIDGDCYQSIKDTFACMEALMENGTCEDSDVENKADLPSALHECHPFSLEYDHDRQVFFYNLQNAWQTNYPGSDNGPKCQMLDRQQDSDVIDRYGQFRLSMKQGTRNCSKKSKPADNDPFENGQSRHGEFLRFIKSVHGQGANSWTWQTCYEFGYFQTPDPKHRLFTTGWSTWIEVERCQAAFPGGNFTSQNIQRRIDETNKKYKGKSYGGNCTIFVNGEWDPWHPLGINKEAETSSANTVISIPRGEHCEDMNYSEEPFVIAAQNRIHNTIGQYLQDPNC